MNEIKNSSVDRLSRSDRRTRDKYQALEDKFIYKYLLKTPAERRRYAKDNPRKSVFDINLFIHDGILVLFVVFLVSMTAYLYSISEHPVAKETTIHNPNEIIHLELKSDVNNSNRVLSHSK